MTVVYLKEYVDYFYNWYVNTPQARVILKLDDWFVFPDGEEVTVGNLMNKIMLNPDDYPLGEE